MVAEAEAGRPSVLKAKGRAVAVLVPAGTTSPVLAAAVAEVLGEPVPDGRPAETGKADRVADAGSRKRLIREAAERRAAVKKAPARPAKKTEEAPVLDELDDEPLPLTDIFEKGIGHE
jgi:hypothetical protein